MHKTEGYIREIRVKGGRVEIKFIRFVAFEGCDRAAVVTIRQIFGLPIRVSLSAKVGRQGADINFP